MELKDKLFRVGFWAATLFLIALIIIGAVGKGMHDREVTDLQNKLATTSQTVEVQKGEYARLAQESNDLLKLLNTKDEQLKALKVEVKKGNEDLLSVNTLMLTWKHAYEATLTGTQTDVPPITPPGTTPDPTLPPRKKVEFEKDYGFLAFKGHTLTDPPEAYVKIWQPRPLKLSVVVSQLPDGSWKSRAISSEDNFSIDIALAAVNPHVLEPKWYENIGLSVDLGAATGFLAGVGVSYKIGNFEVGPKGWVTITSRVDGYVGAGITWHPFAR